MARKAPKKSTASGDDDEPSCCSGSFLLSQSARADEASAERKEGRWVSSHALGGSGRGPPAGGQRQRQRQRRNCGRY